VHREGVRAAGVQGDYGGVGARVGEVLERRPGRVSGCGYVEAEKGGGG